MDRLLEATARAERDHFWFRGFRRFVRPLLARAAAGRRNLAILDCGCGTGNNLAMLRRYGRVWGIDLAWTGLEYARRRGERLVARASATQLPFRDATFDLVASFDVIYSLDDADESAVLREMHRVLRPGGHLVVNVAALEVLRGNHSVLSREVRRYSRSSLRDRLRLAGYETQWISYTNASLLPILLAIRLLQRITGHRESEHEVSVPVAPINAVFTGVLAVEAAALRVIPMPAGSSLLALAAKRESIRA
jgi:ubiquinone/menaquinone biosynthesis C-methylase UbiE